MKVDSYQLYHDYCQPEKARGEEGEGVQGQARAEENVSEDQESTEQYFTIPFIHKSNQSDHFLTLIYQHMISKATVSHIMRCDSHQVESLSSNSRFKSGVSATNC